jgi:hypothetical protein
MAGADAAGAKFTPAAAANCEICGAGPLVTNCGAAVDTCPDIIGSSPPGTTNPPGSTGATRNGSAGGEITGGAPQLHTLRPLPPTNATAITNTDIPPATNTIRRIAGSTAGGRGLLRKSWSVIGF